MIDAKTITVSKLYRDCIKLADYLAFKQGNPSNVLRDQVRKAFRANQNLTDEDKIAQCKQDAINGLANYMFHESEHMAKDLSGKRLPKAK